MRCDASEAGAERQRSGFNPRTYMRCDLFSLFLFLMLTLFQSTHLHEVRRTAIRGKSTLNRSFNPRTYMRCDLQFLYFKLSGVNVSIHAPT